MVSLFGAKVAVFRSKGICLVCDEVPSAEGVLDEASCSSN